MNAFIRRFHEIVSSHQNRNALLVDGAQEISYQTLWDSAQELAHKLGQHAISPGDLVTLEIGKSANYIVGLLACWMSGVAFMPLDPSLPRARRELMRSIAKPKATLQANLDIMMEPESASYDTSLAYIIFTSGSSGAPKGVMVAHPGILNFLDQQIELFAMDKNSRALWLLSAQFDASISDIGTTLLSGAMLCIETTSTLETLANLEKVLFDRAITHLDIPPSLLRTLKPERMPSTLQTIMIGGEVCSVEVIKKWAQSFRLINIYGPTEATVCTSMVQCTTEWHAASIGKPIHGVNYHILDDDQKPVPQGETGELYISGVGLAISYLNAEDLNRKKFITLHNTRFFRTGDMVRPAVNGDYIFLGRKDRQIKIRGQLVAPEEIEAAMLKHPLVDGAAVLTTPRTQGRMMLEGYFESKKPISEEEIRRWLNTSLPSWMKPQRFIALASLPRNMNGKIDYVALSALPPQYPRMSSPLSANPIMAGLQKIIQKALQLEFPPAIEADFFDDLGGDSLLALEVIFSAEKEGLHFSVSALNLHRTIASLAALLSDNDVRIKSDAVAANALRRDSELTPTQQQNVEAGLKLPLSTEGSILLTGATGFLGAQVLQQLVELDATMIYCIVRAPNTAAARKRIEQSMATIGAVWLPTYSARIEVLCGDLTLTQWGLNNASWQMLLHNTASIFHCAATVNMVQSYDELYHSNVAVTQSIVAFASTTRLKAIHYASTLSVFVAADNPPDICYEDALFDTTTMIHGGYAQSKWVADNFMQQCAAKGLPVSIYRFGLITGDSQSGRYAVHDYLAMFVRGLIRLGELPAGDWESLELDVTPVDYAARAMVYIAQGNQRGCYHIAGASRFSLRMIHDVLAEYGYTLLVRDPNNWHPNITDHSEAAATYMALCRLLKSDHTFTRFRSMDLFQATHQQFDQTNTHEALAGTNITCPPATHALLTLYLDQILEGITQ